MRTGAGSSGTGHEGQPLDPFLLRRSEDEDATELCWGDGLVPEGLEDAPPSEGGMYKGKSPAMRPNVNVGRGL